MVMKRTSTAGLDANGHPRPHGARSDISWPGSSAVPAETASALTHQYQPQLITYQFLELKRPSNCGESQQLSDAVMAFGAPSTSGKRFH